MSDMNVWKPCSQCKKPIGYNQKYFVCSVSTCNSQRTGYSFCTITCWDAHLPAAKHRDAGAIEKKSPSSASVAAALSAPAAQVSATSSDGGQRRIIVNSPSAPVPMSGSLAKVPHDILIVVSKLKDYISARSDMNTSADVNDILSNMIRSQCDLAIENARRDGRKTVMARDFK